MFKSISRRATAVLMASAIVLGQIAMPLQKASAAGPTVTGTWSNNCTTFTVNSTYGADTTSTLDIYRSDATPGTNGQFSYHGTAYLAKPLVYTTTDGTKGFTIQVDGIVVLAAKSCSQVASPTVDLKAIDCNTLQFTGSEGDNIIYAPTYQRAVRIKNAAGTYVYEQLAPAGPINGKGDQTYIVPISGQVDVPTGTSYTAEYGMYYNGKWYPKATSNTADMTRACAPAPESFNPTLTVTQTKCDTISVTATELGTYYQGVVRIFDENGNNVKEVLAAHNNVHENSSAINESVTLPVGHIYTVKLYLFDETTNTSYEKATAKNTIDLTKACLGSISGTVYWDNDQSQDISDTDAPYENKVVYLVDDKGNKIAETITDKDGNYRFTNISAGTYSVYIIPAVGTEIPTTPKKINDITVNREENVTDIDFGLFKPGKGAGPVETDKPVQNTAPNAQPIVAASPILPTPSELPETGSSWNGMLTAAIAALSAYGVIYFAQFKRRLQ